MPDQASVMNNLKLFRVTGAMSLENYEDDTDDYLVVAESAEDAEAVWTKGEDGFGSYRPEDGYRFLCANEVSAEELIEFGGGDDGWGDHLPDGAEVLTRRQGPEGEDWGPDRVRVAAGALARFFGRMVISDPNY